MAEIKGKEAILRFLKVVLRSLLMVVLIILYTLFFATGFVPFVAVMLAQSAGLGADSSIYALLGAWFLPCLFTIAALFWLYVQVIKKTWSLIKIKL